MSRGIKQSLGWVSLLVVMGLALGTRLYRFGDIPHGVNRDEAAIGYTAKLIFTTGREEHGQRLPLKFESFGDWKQPLYIYLTVPFILLWGLSPQTVRVLSLFGAMGMMVAAYFLTQRSANRGIKKLFPGIMALIFLTVNPWHFHFSRLALEAMLSASLISLAILALMARSVKVNIWGVGLLILSLFTYHAALIFVPVWFGGYLWIYRKKLDKLWFRIAAVFLITIWSLIMVRAWSSREQAKMTGTTIFNLTNEQMWQEIYQYRNENIGSKLIHNQYIYFTRVLVTNYISNWTPKFLFYSGGIHPHYNIPGFGNFLIIEIILAIVGIGWVIKTKNRFGSLIVLAFLVAPLPAALTTAGAHSTRSVFMLPYVQILAALGLMALLRISETKWVRGLILTVILALVIFPSFMFFKYYFGSYRAISDQRFDGYMKDVSLYLKNQPVRLQAVYITYPFESPYIFYAFYTDLDPKIFLRNITYYPTDALGFKYAKSLLNQQYVPTAKSLENVDLMQSDGALILSRIDEISPGIPIMTFFDLTNKPQIEVRKL